MVPTHSNVSAFDAAYRATTYIADLPQGPVGLRIDEPCPVLDRYLAQRASATWAFVSASNPGSQLLSDAQNAERHAQLIESVAAQGWEWVAGRGVPDDGNWPPELSLLILNIGLQNALALAAEFGQNAIVAGVAGSCPQLVYVHGNCSR